jgi:hypothetical protein
MTNDEGGEINAIWYRGPEQNPQHQEKSQTICVNNQRLFMTYVSVMYTINMTFFPSWLTKTHVLYYPFFLLSVHPVLNIAPENRGYTLI